MDDARTVVAQFQRLGMVDEWHGLGIWVALGIGVHHARNVFPNGDLFGTRGHGEQCRTVIGPFSAEGRGFAIFVPTNESLRHHNLTAGVVQRFAQGLPCQMQGGFIDPGKPVGAVGGNGLSNVPPNSRFSHGLQPCVDQGGAGQFSRRHQGVVGHGLVQDVTLRFGSIGLMPARLHPFHQAA